MDYKELNDNELVYLCQENNEDASKLLIDKYKPCIDNIIHDYIKNYHVVGIEKADLYQECLIGLIHAINSFNDSKDVTFYTYANACIKSTLVSALRQSFRKKNKPLNNSYSLDNLIDESNNSFYDILRDEKSDPNDLLLQREETIELINKLKEKLSKNEYKIFEYKVKGLSNIEIAKLLNNDKKYIENTIFRINKKYKELL